MKYIIKLALFFLISPAAFASIVVKAEPNIFDNTYVISAGKIKDIIASRLYEQNIDGELVISIYNYDKGIGLKKPSQQYTITIQDFKIKENIRRFNTSLFFTGDEGVEKIDLYGKYEELVEIPVLSSRLRHKTVINKSDIDYMNYPKHKLKHDTVIDESFLIGKELKRSMRSMSPIRGRDIIKQRIVSRNDTVDIIYKTKFITLTTTGIALEDGSMGDSIKIRNSESNKTIQAVVKNEKLVMIKDG